MISKIVSVIFAGSRVAGQADWVAAGNGALSSGRPEEAAADFARAVDADVRAGAPAGELLHLRVTLATAYMEAGDDREMEAVLQEAQKTAGPAADGVSRAELLNAWSALHLRRGRLSAAEAELQEAWGIVKRLPDAWEIRPTVLHNLASVEMRTGRYAEALSHEQEAIGLIEKSPAADRRTLIRGWASMASLRFMMGEPEQARGLMDRAIASAEVTFGPTHLLVADLLDSDAVVLEKLKLKKAARQARERAERIRGGPARAGQEQLSWNVRETPKAAGGVYLQSK